MSISNRKACTKSLYEKLYLIEKSIFDRNEYTKFLYLTEKYVRKVNTKSLYLTEKSIRIVYNIIEKSISNRNDYPKCLYLKKCLYEPHISNRNVYI